MATENGRRHTETVRKREREKKERVRKRKREKRESKRDFICIKHKKWQSVSVHQFNLQADSKHLNGLNDALRSAS